MADMTTGDSRGWRSAFRVRMLHAQVRVRIQQGKARHNVYDQEENGVPINQACVVQCLKMSRFIAHTTSSCTETSSPYSGRS